LSSQDTVRDRQGQVACFAEVCGVREANGGGCWVEQSCRAHLQAGFGHRIRAWPSVSSSRIVISLIEGPRDPRNNSGKER